MRTPSMIRTTRCVAALLTLTVVVSGLTPAAAQLKSTKVPRFDVAVAKAVGYLQKAEKISERDLTLAAYALVKAGVKTNDQLVKEGIELAVERSTKTGYRGYDHIYLAGVDAMLLADVDSDLYTANLQRIADHVQRTQHPDGSWSDLARAPGDVSMTQYGVLALWAAQRVGVQVNGKALDDAAAFLMSKGNGDGGWGYRPGTTQGPGKGNSTHNMTIAAAGTIAVGRTLLHGPRGGLKKKKDAPKYGVLEKEESAAEKAAASGNAFPNYSPRSTAGSMDGRIDRAFGWNRARFTPVSRAEHKIYYYYALERAAALADLGDGWFQTYGDGLLTLQAADGSFPTHSGANNGTSLAILYFMRSTQQILDKQYGVGIMAGGKGLENLYGKKEKKKELSPLGELLGELENIDLSKLDNLNTDDIVQTVQFGNKEELIGQVDKLKVLIKSPKAEHRQAAYYALGRTGNFDLVPEILGGLRDKNLDVGVEALMALRYIARKPNGFGVSTEPLAGPRITSDDQRLVRANNWRDKAHRAWADWYRRVRPYEESDGLDELELLVPLSVRK